MLPRVSVVIPCCNEEGNIHLLFETLIGALGGVADCQVVFVDDGSTDGTLGEIRSLAEESNAVKYISFSRNFGHQYALKAGLDHVDADCVVMMDADMQHPPGLVVDMIEKWKEGYDVVFTTREDDKRIPWLKRATSSGFYWLLNRLGDISLERGAADFRLIDRKVLKVFREDINEYFLFIRGLTAWVGFKQVAIRYRPADRHAGETKYRLFRMLSFAINGVTSFSIRPIRLCVILGVLISAAAGFYAIYAIAARFFIQQTIPGWTSVIISVLFIGGIQMFMLGIIGEYIGKMFYEVKKRPKYIIKDSNL